jgi:hypothetical protein
MFVEAHQVGAFQSILYLKTTLAVNCITNYIHRSCESGNRYVRHSETKLSRSRFQKCTGYPSVILSSGSPKEGGRLSYFP